MRSKIVNGKILAEDEILIGKALYIENGVIAQISDQELPYDTLIDAKGCYVSAGFIDLHCHGALGFDFSDGTAEAVITAANYHCKHGTTTIFPTTLSSSYD